MQTRNFHNILAVITMGAVILFSPTALFAAVVGLAVGAAWAAIAGRAALKISPTLGAFFALNVLMLLLGQYSKGVLYSLCVTSMCLVAGYCVTRRWRDIFHRAMQMYLLSAEGGVIASIVIVVGMAIENRPPQYLAIPLFMAYGWTMAMLLLLRGQFNEMGGQGNVG